MHFLASAPLLLAVPLVSAAVVTISACPKPSSKAVYFLDNNPSGAGIYALSIAEDGTVSDPVRTSTGGVGLYGLQASTTGGAAAAAGQDTLFSQDAVVVSQNYLFTVNAGSNSVSLFYISQDNPQHPTLIGSPASSLGEFPQAVAYSPLLKTACVLNGGAIAGVACFSVDSKKGLEALGGLRPIALNQTTPPVGPPGTVSDIVFNPSQTALIATVKGNGVTPGYIYSYPVEWDGSIATKPVVSRPSELALDFSINFLGEDSRAVITDPSYGASLVDITPSLEFSVAAKVPIAGQSAICWSVYSASFDTIFILDAGVTNITLLDPWSGAIKGTIDGAADTGGNLDAKANGQYLYVLNAAAYVSVIDNTGLTRGDMPKEIQSFNLSSLGSRQGYMGLAIFPSE